MDFRVWIQPDRDKTILDPGTIQSEIKLTFRQLIGVSEAIAAFYPAVNMMIERDYDQQFPRRQAFGRIPAYREVQTLDIPNLYEYVKHGEQAEQPIQPKRAKRRKIKEKPIRKLPRMWVLFIDPFPVLGRIGFIIAFKTAEDLQGIFSVFEWLGFNPLNSLVKIQDEQGNNYVVDT